MERFQYAIALRHLAKLQEEAQSAVDKFESIPRTNRDQWVNGSITYWKHVVKAMKWAISRTKIAQRKSDRVAVESELKDQ